MDIAVGASLAAGFIAMFVCDTSLPRGYMDGLGYGAVIALSSRFGTRAVIASAALASILVLSGAIVGIDAGITVLGTLINRAFAILEIAVVTGVLLHRLELTQYIEARNRDARKFQNALTDAVREGLQSEKPIVERIHRVTELGAEALQADMCAVIKASAVNGLATVKVIDVWDIRKGAHFSVPDIQMDTSPGYKEQLEQQQYVCSEDVTKSPLHVARQELHRRLGICAALTAAPMGYDRGLPMLVFAYGGVHHWTEDEIAFGRSLANIVAIQSTTTRADQMLRTLDLIGIGVYVSSPNGDIRYSNRAAIDLAREFGSNDGAEFPAPDEPLLADQDVHTLARAGRELEISRLRVPGGEILTSMSDVTERNSALAERRRLEARLQQASKMEAIGQLAGGVAHDFNNILGSILGFAGFLAEDLPTGSPSQNHALRILRAARRGSQLVEQTLAFANTQAVDFTNINLNDLLELGQEALGDLVSTEVQFAMHKPPCPLIVKGNAVQIGQLITNLSKNARDALEGMGGHVVISAALADSAEIERLHKGPPGPEERLVGDFEHGRQYCLLRVTDDGPGIEAGLLDRIFEPFFTTKGRHRGTGLGLAVVHGVVKSHRAVMHVRAPVGKGAVFTIYFPLALGLQAAAPASVTDDQNLKGSERVLVVDDEPDVADALTIGLERLGYRAVSVNDPVEALAAITEDPEAFDVLITDELMPGMRGMELIPATKRIKPDLRTVLCTGHSANTNKHTAQLAGADLFFYKPVSAAEISARLRQVLARTK
jgi:signal transduction histidine kinase/CheY-like chemotaxis protein